MNRFHIRKHMKKECMALLVVGCDLFSCSEIHPAFFSAPMPTLTKGTVDIFLMNKVLPAFAA